MMRIIFTAARPVSLVLSVIIVLTAVSHRYATAAMVSTETIVNTARGEVAYAGILVAEEIRRVGAEDNLATRS